MVKFTAFIIVQLNGVENNAQSSCTIILSKAFVVFAVETSIAHSVLDYSYRAGVDLHHLITLTLTYAL